MSSDQDRMTSEEREERRKATRLTNHDMTSSDNENESSGNGRRESLSRHDRIKEARQNLRGIQRYGTYCRYGVVVPVGNAETATAALPPAPPPTTSETTNTRLPWSPHLRALFCGTRDPQSPLVALLGHETTILRHVYELLIETWLEHIKRTPPARTVARFTHIDDNGFVQNDPLEEGRDVDYFRSNPVPMVNVLISRDDNRDMDVLGNRVEDRPEIAWARCGDVLFPPPRDNCNVNMLPFIMGDKESLPSFLQPYYDGVISRCPVEDSELGKVCFLTISEGNVNAGETQRRPGLHIEAPGSVSSDTSFVAAWEHSWGMGHAFTQDEFHGGLFMASTMDNTCEVWDALVSNTATGLVDHHGGIEHLRPFIGEGTKLRSNELVWLTDRTPHEAIPQEQNGYRQFFRLVTSQVSVWYAAHSTPNAKVPLPHYVRVVEASKF